VRAALRSVADPERAAGALRDLAKSDPAWVRRFLAEHELSPLSRREAAKHL
jgi:3-methyladenine DNA glycosylase AlkD